MESISMAMFSNSFSVEQPLNSYLEELLFMTRFMDKKTKMQLVADEDWFSACHLLDRKSQKFRGIFGILQGIS
jgi:hypothetical protein